MILKIIRQILGRLIILLNCVFSPAKLKRGDAEQAKVDVQTKDLVLYQFHMCPFCVRVRRHITRLNLKVETRDVNANPVFEKELIAGGGKRKVPCLRIQDADKVTWLYESLAINAYLSKRFGH